MIARLQIDAALLNQAGEGIQPPAGNVPATYQSIYLALLDHQRNILNDMNRGADFDEELIRKHLSFIDLEEFKLRGKLLET